MNEGASNLIEAADLEMEVQLRSSFWFETARW